MLRATDLLDAAIDRVEAEAANGEIVGVGLTGKPFIFAVGADLKGVELLGRRDDALAIGRGGHDDGSRGRLRSLRSGARLLRRP